MEFYKLHGAGNDFIFLVGKPCLPAEVITDLCNRKMGIGADGLIFLEEIVAEELAKKEFSFKMHYYNSDGSSVSFCGNGARCAVALAKHLNFFKGDYVKFLAGDGEHEAYVSGKKKIKLRLLKPSDFREDIKVDEVDLDFNFVNTGVEHAVAFVDNIEEVDVTGIGTKVRNDSQFENGTNVDFAFKDEDEIIHVRTFERGVEDETLACGTGICAVAYIDMLLSEDFSKRKMRTWSQEKMDVEYKGGYLYLTGPAVLVYKGNLMY